MGQWREAAKDSAGGSAVEFALVLPVLLTILFSILKFGVTLNADLQLTDGVRAACTPILHEPLQHDRHTRWQLRHFQNATHNLTYAHIGGASGATTPTFKVNGTACSSDSGCATALSTAIGGTSNLTATYPCDLNIMGVNLAPNCTLTASTSDLVE